MAREVILVISCDLCQNLDDKKVDAKEMPPVQVGNNKARILALCPEHQEQFFDKFLEVLLDLGVTTDVLANTQSGRTKKKTSGSSSNGGSETGKKPHPGMDSNPEALIPCPLIAECNTENSFKSRGSLQGHMKNFHDGVSVGAALERLGMEYLLDDEGNIAVPDSGRDSGPLSPPTEQRAECDQPGCTTVYEWPKHARPNQALSIHKAKTHGIKGQSKTNKNRRAAHERRQEESLAEVS